MFGVNGLHSVQHHNVQKKLIKYFKLMKIKTHFRRIVCV